MSSFNGVCRAMYVSALIAVRLAGALERGAEPQVSIGHDGAVRMEFVRRERQQMMPSAQPPPALLQDVATADEEAHQYPQQYQYGAGGGQPNGAAGFNGQAPPLQAYGNQAPGNQAYGGQPYGGPAYGGAGARGGAQAYQAPAPVGAAGRPIMGAQGGGYGGDDDAGAPAERHGQLYDAQIAAARFQELEYRAERRAGLPDQIFTSSTRQPVEEMETEQEENDLIYGLVAIGLIVLGVSLYKSNKDDAQKTQAAIPQAAAPRAAAPRAAAPAVAAPQTAAPQLAAPRA